MPRVSGQGRHVPDVKGAQGIPDVRGAQGIPDVRALRCFGGRGAATPRSRLRREDKDIVVRGGPRGRPVGHAEQVRQGQDGHHESLVTVDADECRKKLCGKGGVCEAKMWWFSGLGRSAVDPAAGRTREIRGGSSLSPGQPLGTPTSLSMGAEALPRRAKCHAQATPPRTSKTQPS